MSEFLHFDFHFPALRRLSELLLPFALLCVLTLLMLTQPWPLRFLQSLVFDQYNRLHPRAESPDSAVVYLDIDEESLLRLGQFPWPRALFGELVKRAQGMGVAVLAFDILFAEPDRTAPTNILPVWSQSVAAAGQAQWQAAQRTILERVADPDTVLADAIGAASVVVAVVLDGANSNMPAPKAGIVLRSAGALGALYPLDLLPGSAGATANLPAIQEAASGIGIINARFDRDGVIRRSNLFFRGTHGALYANLAVEALRVAQRAGSIALKASDLQGESRYSSGLGLSRMKLGQIVAPIEPDGSMRLYFAESRDLVRIPIWEVFEPDFDASRLAGRIAFVGTSAAGLKDIRATPLDPATPGVELHVQTAQQLISGTHLRRSLRVLIAETGMTFGIGIILILLSARYGAVPSTLLVLTAIAGGFAVSLDYFRESLLLVDPLMPSVTLCLTLITGSTLNHLRIAAEKHEVREAFQHYLSRDLVEQIARDPRQLKLGGETRLLTIMFADIRGFTTLSEHFDDAPEKLTHIINIFLTKMTELIQARSGTIDKYIGDCIMAFWNAPTALEGHALAACEAAWGMQHALGAIDAQLRSDPLLEGSWTRPMRIGVGLNTGDTLVGNVGSDQRFNYSAMGDAVNIAARLEGQTKHYGVGILLGARCYDEARVYLQTHEIDRPPFDFVELDLIALKGKSHPERIYGLVDTSDAEFHKQHAQWLAAYRAGSWNLATELAMQGAQNAPALAAYYEMMATRIEALRAHPPDAWDGVHIAQEK